MTIDIGKIIKNIIGVTPSEEQAVEMFLSTLYHATERLPRVTFFFPDDVPLHAVTVIGNAPRVGEKVFIHTLLRRGSDDPNYNYDKEYLWAVERVDHSITVPDANSEADHLNTLKQGMYGQATHRYNIEVKLRHLTEEEKNHES